MRKRISTLKPLEKILLDKYELAEVCSLGIHRAREWADSIGATVHVGTRVLFNKRVIEEHLEGLHEATASKDA